MAITIGTTNRYEWDGSVDEITYPTVQSDPAFGILQRRNINPNRSRTWRLRFRFATQAEKDAFLSEFNSAKGSCGEITFTPPGSASAVTARFADPSMSWLYHTPALREISFDVVQDVELV